MSLYEKYNKEIKQFLRKSLDKKNPHQVPKIEKVIVTMWVGSLHTRKWIKDFSDLEKNLKNITGQKPMMVRSRKSIANFKLREDMPSMLVVTLRKERAYDFIERLVDITLPRVRDFTGINVKSFDKTGNYNLWFKDQSVFAEISMEEATTPIWVGVTIVTNTVINSDAKELLKSLWLIFRENN